MRKELEKQLELIKNESFELVKISAQKKKQVILEIAKQLEKHKDSIFEENKKDVLLAIKKGKSQAFVERLTISEKGFLGMVLQLKTVAGLENVLGEIIEQRTLANGINLRKIRFPIGVIFAIYESRPNVTVDVVGLCIKSGNAVILKGGSESARTNRALLSCIHTAFKKYTANNHYVTYLDAVSHKEVEEILKRNDLIDVVIPRGSYELTKAVAEKSRIPILYHAAGGAKAYIDKSANIQMAIDLVVNAKTQRNSVCNALDCIIVHKDIAEKILGKLADQLVQNGVEVRIDRESVQIDSRLSYKRTIFNEASRGNNKIKLATEKDFSTEFLDAIVAIKIVESENEAIEFIKKHSNHHTEMLVAESKDVIKKFVQEIDAAALMINCSSRLNDGGEFGMGAEMGTATGKLHARGPVGVRELTTYKWIAYGEGQIKK